MATVNKNFRIKHGLVVEGTTGTIDGNNILTENASDTYILNLIGGETLVKSVSGDLSVDGSGNLSIDTEGLFDTLVSDGMATETYVTNAIGNIDLTYTTDDVTEGTNLYFTNQRALDATSAAYDAAGAASAAQTAAESYADGLATNYDAAGAASAAQTAAESYADGLASNYDAAGSATTAYNNAVSYADGLASNYDPAGSASTAQTNAQNYADTALESYTPTSSLDTTIDGYGYLKSADLSGYATESYVGTAIDNLVDGAPGLLDTLNEIAAAIADDENYATTMTTALSGKQNNLTAGSNIDITSDTISVTGLDAADISDFNTAALSATSAAYDANGAAATAESNANSYTDEAAGDILDGTSAFSLINISDAIAQKAAKTTLASIATGSSVMSWSKSAYPTAKLWVKFATATHSQVSEVLLTSDSSNNVAITEFAEVGTNGSLGTVTAVYNSGDGNIGVQVNTVYANTTVTVMATLIK